MVFDLDILDLEFSVALDLEVKNDLASWSEVLLCSLLT